MFAWKILFLISLGFGQVFAASESFNFQPGINLFTESVALTDIMGSKGSQLCAPIAITHAFNFLKYKHSPAFSSLNLTGSYQSQIRSFYQKCGTDKNNGTQYPRALSCMRKFIEDSGYSAWVYMVGPDASIVPPGSSLSDIQRAVSIDDIRYYVSNSAAVIMTIGWYKLNPATRVFERESGHFINIYGYDHQEQDGQNHVTLKVVNSLVNYQGRAPSEMFDTLAMKRVHGSGIPSGREFELTGNGVNYPGYKSLVEDILIAYPYEQ